MSAIADYPQRHAISAEEYVRMASAGVFATDVRLELMEGELIEMAPIGSVHAAVVNALAALLNRLCSESAIVSVQNPVIMGDRSVPQPDLALLKLRSDRYFRDHPRAADVLLLIEVSDTTLQFDLEQKSLLYARAGVHETWVIDLTEATIHVLRDQAPEGYANRLVVQRNDLVVAQALPAVTFKLESLFRTGIS